MTMLQEEGPLETPGTVKLVTLGRRSRLPHVVEVRYTADGNGFYLIGAGARADWVLNALTLGSVKVRLGEFSIPCKTRMATEWEAEQTLRRFRRKYGDRIVDQWYGGRKTFLFLERVGPPERRGAVKGETETLVNYMQWKMKGRQYYSDVAAAFDSASEEYDFTISRNFINTWIRRRSMDILQEFLKREDVALEIGCGTGAETLRIARSVRKVIAMDISERMIALVQSKVSARKVSNVVPLLLGAKEIDRVAPHLVGGTATVAYSLNGALNCEPELDAFVGGLEKVLATGGFFVCSVRNKICLSEAVLHALLLQFRKALPRLKQPTMVSVGGMDIPSTYYGPTDFANHFKRSFKLRRTVALPAILPPAYLSNYYIRLGAMHSPLDTVERLVAGLPPFNRLGDQTLFVFQRTG